MRKNFYIALALVGFLALSAIPCLGAVYPGNGDVSYGGAVGNGNLNLTDKGTWMSASFNKGGDSGVSFHGDLVIFIDSEAGGYNTTSQFTDKDNELTSAISGLNVYSGARSVANFAPGFFADYAIAVGVNAGGALYKIDRTDSGPILNWVGNVNFQPTYNQNLPTYTFYFLWDWLGMNQS